MKSPYQIEEELMHGPRIFCRGCHGDVMSRSDFGYCRDCQDIHDECMAARAARMHKPAAVQQRQPDVSHRRARRVGVGPVDACFFDFSEVDWQDVLHPNEGAL